MANRNSIMDSAAEEEAADKGLYDEPGDDDPGDDSGEDLVQDSGSLPELVDAPEPELVAGVLEETDEGPDYLAMATELLDSAGINNTVAHNLVSAYAMVSIAKDIRRMVNRG